MAMNGPSCVSLDWLSHMRLLDGIDTFPKPVTYLATHTPVDALVESPFILDTRAICHISPIKLDFKSLCPIAPYPITSIGGAQVHTTCHCRLRVAVGRTGLMCGEERCALGRHWRS